MQPPMQYTGQKPVDPLILNVWPSPDGQSSSYTLYEDESDAESYNLIQDRDKQTNLYGYILRLRI
jgi:hypothetical protein